MTSKRISQQELEKTNIRPRSVEVANNRASIERTRGSDRPWLSRTADTKEVIHRCRSHHFI